MKWSIVILSLLIIKASFGTHLRSAEILVQREDCNTLKFKFIVIAYTNTTSGTVFGGNNFQDGSLSFGDGTFVIIPATSATARPDLGPNIGIAKFETTHTFSQIGDYKINYFERDRNGAIINIFDPGDTPFSASVLISAASIQNCNRYPSLAIPPVDKTCPGVTFFHNSGASDPDGDSLSFELTIPFKDANTIVDGYFSPANQKFYTNFNQGNEERNGQPRFEINATTGLITWDAPGMAGEYNIAFKIVEWKTNSSTTGIPTLMSTTIRDMQITVEACQNGRPDVVIPQDLCVVAGTVIDNIIFGFDPQDDKVKIEFVSDVFSLSFQPPTLTPADVAFRISDPADTVKFHWQTDCLHVRDQAYQIVIKITDSPKFGFQLVTIKTWRIKIIAPMPIWKQVSLDLVNRKSVLEWEPYSCPNAQYVQVWRKIGHYAYSPGQCDAGLPKYLGYELIGEVNPTDSIFIDNNSTKGLVDGALYCYRLVAIFPLPSGGKSYTTKEQCVGPILTDAPVITHVSVEATDKEEGAIRVSWRSPFKIDGILFPKPYRYDVYRSYGFNPKKNLLKVGEVLGDTSYLNLNINTSDSAFNFSIVIYSKPLGFKDFIAVDTSFTASSVRLNAASGEGKIELNWLAQVPWSNIIEGSPFHFIYRGSKTDSPLPLLLKVDVTENGFNHVDQSVDPSKYYCYRVMTRGTYGNPSIDTLKNFSQKVCLYPKNNLLPCTPSLSIVPNNCENFLSTANCSTEFSNTINWLPNEQAGCRIDIVSFNVYASSAPDGEFSLVKKGLTAHNFIDLGLKSFARCYRVTSIDTQGKESSPSELVCNDNCAYFELPNVFTPGNLDGCNDTFRAFKSLYGETYPCHSNTTGTTNSCSFFINSVSFKVFDRWGKEVFSSSTSEGLPASIEWKGETDQGAPLVSGVYFYWAEVAFDVMDESKKFKTLKGWVHLVR